MVADLLIGKMTPEYSCVRATRRWPFRVFMEMLDMAALNAYIVWISKNTEWKKNDRSRRKIFLEELSTQLVKNNVIERRQSNHSFHQDVQLSFNLFYKEFHLSNEEEKENSPTKLLKTRRCSFCPRTKDKKTKNQCCVCERPICVHHSFNLCPDCKNN